MDRNIGSLTYLQSALKLNDCSIEVSLGKKEHSDTIISINHTVGMISLHADVDCLVSIGYRSLKYADSLIILTHVVVGYAQKIKGHDVEIEMLRRLGMVQSLVGIIDRLLRVPLDLRVGGHKIEKHS